MAKSKKNKAIKALSDFFSIPTAKAATHFDSSVPANEQGKAFKKLGPEKPNAVSSPGTIKSNQPGISNTLRMLGDPVYNYTDRTISKTPGYFGTNIGSSYHETYSEKPSGEASALHQARINALNSAQKHDENLLKGNNMLGQGWQRLENTYPRIPGTESDAVHNAGKQQIQARINARNIVKESLKNNMGTPGQMPNQSKEPKASSYPVNSNSSFNKKGSGFAMTKKQTSQINNYHANRGKRFV